MIKYFYLRIITIILFLLSSSLFLQAQVIQGNISSEGEVLPYASVGIQAIGKRSTADSQGNYKIEGLNCGTYLVYADFVGFNKQSKLVELDKDKVVTLDFELTQDLSLDEIVISGSLKPVSKADAVTSVEIYTKDFFEKNPSTNLFDAVQMINGVHSVVNCNVCNTGDIHINGMEGAYTMILIDGMPIVSSLSSVYGLFGIPTSLIKHLEVVKGPASSLYGTEAMGGIINVITKDPQSANPLSIDIFSTTWLENNIDLGAGYGLGENLYGIFGANYFKFGQPKDKNNDGFTDITQQERISLFNKLSLNRPMDRIASLAMRYVYEDRWGGQTNWNPSKDRGSTQIYGESIFTNRFEVIGMYQFASTQNIYSQFSFIHHEQNSMYGPESYKANQNVSFAQVYWDKNIKNHSLLLGTSFKYTFYDDNTRATGIYDDNGFVQNKAQKTPILGLFLQDEWSLTKNQKLLLGYRFDYDQTHGGIHSPRIGYKLSVNKNSALRASFGTGFRVVNVFTEDHRALSGAREVVFAEVLKPEKSYNMNLNYNVKMPTDFGLVNFDVNGFYTYFTNKIDADTDTDQTKIIYANLDGFAVSKGVSLNVDVSFYFPLKLMGAMTYMQVYREEHQNRKQIYHSPKWSGNFLASYDFGNGLTSDFTMDWKGPMLLPTVQNDYRSQYSPWTFIGNLQVSKKFNDNFQVYAGAKNIFNTIVKQDVIARWWDPFGEPGNGVAPPEGRHDVIFEPNDYSYTALQGIRGFIGVRYNIL